MENNSDANLAQIGLRHKLLNKTLSPLLTKLFT